MQTHTKDRATSFGLLILRLGVGGFMLTHGWGKFQMLLDGKFEEFADPLGMGMKLSLIGAVGAEFFCAILVALGLLTRFAALPLVFTMAVAVFVVHANDPWSSETAAKLFFAGESKTWFSREPAMLYLIPCLTLIFTGAGRYSLDALLFSRGCKRCADDPGSMTHAPTL